MICEDRGEMMTENQICDIAISILLGLAGFVLSLPIYASLAYATEIISFEESAYIAGVGSLITGIGVFYYTLKYLEGVPESTMRPKPK